jgi:hypothetical protein
MYRTATSSGFMHCDANLKQTMVKKKIKDLFRENNFSTYPMSFLPFVGIVVHVNGILGAVGFNEVSFGQLVS